MTEAAFYMLERHFVKKPGRFGSRMLRKGALKPVRPAPGTASRDPIHEAFHVRAKDVEVGGSMRTRALRLFSGFAPIALLRVRDSAARRDSEDRRMTDVVMFCITDKVSGGEMYTVQLLAALDRAGLSSVIVGSSIEALQKLASSNGVALITTDRVGPKLGKKSALRIALSIPRQMRAFAKILDEFPDATFILQYKLEQLLFGLGTKKSKVIFLEHGPIPRMIRLPVLRSVYRRGLRRAVASVAVSAPAAEAIAAMGGHAHVIAAGVALDRRQQAMGKAAEAREILENAVSASTIGIYAGRITHAKGVLAAAQACLLADGVGLVIYGLGPDVDELRVLIAGSSRVRYMGASPNVLPFIAAADFSMLFTADSGEGRPLVALESLAMGTPVLGLVGSPAMESLQEEFGTNNVLLLQNSSPSELEKALSDSKSGVDAKVSTWDDSAQQLGLLIRGQ